MSEREQHTDNCTNMERTAVLQFVCPEIDDSILYQFSVLHKPADSGKFQICDHAYPIQSECLDAMKALDSKAAPQYIVQGISGPDGDTYSGTGKLAAVIASGKCSHDLYCPNPHHYVQISYTF